MAKVSGLFVILAGTASLCTACAIHSRTAVDRRIASKQSDIVKEPRTASEAALAVTSDGWRAYLGSATASVPTEKETAPVVVTIVKRKNMPDANSLRSSSAEPATAMSGDRAALARVLQRELRRVGCYDGTLNGIWTPATRTAMKTFTNRVNAILPVDEPDPILLTLVQDYRERVCGVACPVGETLTKDDRCLPTVILALASKTTRPDATSTIATKPRDLVTSATPPQLELRGSTSGRMLLAGPPRGAKAKSVVSARATRGRAMGASRGAAQRSGNFGSSFFRQADSLGPH
jgi:hypothetical protein